MPETKATLVVPVEKENGETVAHNAAQRIARGIGGVSMYKGTGMWMSNEAGLVKEPHMRIEATGDTEISGIITLFKHVATDVKSELGEESVYVEFQSVDTELI